MATILNFEGIFYSVAAVLSVNILKSCKFYFTYLLHFYSLAVSFHCFFYCYYEV